MDDYQRFLHNAGNVDDDFAPSTPCYPVVVVDDSCTENAGEGMDGR